MFRKEWIFCVILLSTLFSGYPPSLFLESTEDIKDDKTLDIFENVMAGTTAYFTNNSTNVVGSVHIPDGMTERIVSDV